MRKSPYLFSRYAVVTYDSFLISLFACPVPEISRIYAHRDTGVMAACGGGVLLDEAHLVLGIDDVGDADEEESKAFTSLVVSIQALSGWLGRPVVAATATMPRECLETLAHELAKRKVRVEVHACLGKRGLEYYRDSLPLIEHGLDPEYEQYFDLYRNSVKTLTTRGALEDDIEYALDSGARSVLVFCNTVGRAVDCLLYTSPSPRDRG